MSKNKNSKIISIPNAKQAAHNVAAAAEAAQKEQENIFEAIMARMDSINGNLGGFEELSAMMALPEEMFAILGPAFLYELEKSLNNMNDKLVLVQALNASGMTCDDVRAEYAQIAQDIDKLDPKVVSRQKRDFLKQMVGMVYNGIAEVAGTANKHINIAIEKCHPDAKMPTYANPGDSGMDVYAVEDITIPAGATVLVPTGLKMAIPMGYEIQVRPKSGRALKTKLRIANTPGTIDSGYRNEIKVIIDNIAAPIKDAGENGTLYGEAYTIEKGDKFCQFVLCEVPKAVFTEVESVASIDNDGRKGGFGSTGVK